MQSSWDSTRVPISIFVMTNCKIFPYMFHKVNSIECQLSMCNHMLLKRQCLIHQAQRNFSVFEQLTVVRPIAIESRFFLLSMCFVPKMMNSVLVSFICKRVMHIQFFILSTYSSIICFTSVSFWLKAWVKAWSSA